MNREIAFAIIIALVPIDAAMAQDSYNTIYGFGDSYADTNDPGDPGGLLTTIGLGPPFNSDTPLGRFSNGTNFVDRLQQNFGITDDEAINFAYGGALTDTSNVINYRDPPISLPLGFLTEVSQAASVEFEPDDIIALSIGGNNVNALLSGHTVPDATAYGIQSAADVGNGVQALVDQGARTITYIPLGGNYYPINPLPVDPAIGQAVNDYAEAFAPAVQREMAAIAAQGVRVNFFNFAELQRRVFDGGEAARFGFFDAAAQGIPVLPDVPCLEAPCDPADAGTYFYWDAVHLTEAGYNLVGDFMTIQLVQNETIPVQADLAQIQALNFTETLMQRINTRRNGAAGFSASYSAKDVPDPKALSWKDETAPFVPNDEFALFVAGGYAAGDRDERAGIVGFDYDLRNLVIGGDYKLGEFTQVGAAIGYTNASADYSFLRGNGDTELDSINLGAYASLAYPNFFADLAIAYSINDYDQNRTGIVSPFGAPVPLDVAGETEGDSFVADFRTGYLFNAAPAFDIGPIAGLSYSNVTVDAYTESGDSLLTLNVEEQTLESLIGSVGVMMRYKSGGIEPYMAVTLEKELLNDRDYSFALTSAPQVVNTVDIGDDNDPYGRIRAGVKAQLSDTLIGSIDGNATFGRETGDDYAITGALKYQF